MSQETPASTTEAQIKNKRRISPFWLLPFIALMIAGWLIWDSYQDRGNTVTIDFMSADGIVPGRTPVRYQGVEVGTVQDISLSDDLRKIEVKVSIKSDMKDALREGDSILAGDAKSIVGRCLRAGRPRRWELYRHDAG